LIFGTAVLSDDVSIDAAWLRSDSSDADGPTAGPGAGRGPLLLARAPPKQVPPLPNVQPLSNGRVVKTFVEAVGIVCHAAVAGRPSGYAGKAKSLRPSLPPTRLAGATIGACVEPNAKRQWFKPRSSNFRVAFARLVSGTSTTATIAGCSSKAKRAHSWRNSAPIPPLACDARQRGETTLARCPTPSSRARGLCRPAGGRAAADRLLVAAALAERRCCLVHTFLPCTGYA
jgi:hypothetical protein